MRIMILQAGKQEYFLRLLTDQVNMQWELYLQLQWRFKGGLELTRPFSFKDQHGQGFHHHLIHFPLQ